MIKKSKYFGGATLSDCGTYRFDLYRVWDEGGPILGFIMLNPSKADAHYDDHTICKVIKIAQHNGFGSIFVYNLFPLRATNPKELESHPRPDHDENYGHIRRSPLIVDEMVFAWGANKFAREKAKEVITQFPSAKALHINKDGSPKHPLYCRDKTNLVPFNNPKKKSRK